MIGKTISHYHITEKLGAGGMGVVYRAEDTKLKRDVALKFLAPELTREPEAKARFVHEAQAAAALHHANICTVYEIDEAAGQMFIAMACIEGRSLKEKIQAGPLALQEALDLAVQVAEGLREAHQHGIVHRDIKPANIMLTAGGQAQIMDFGLATSRGQTKLTRTNTTLGTFAYMSPEQSRGEEVDHRADIWSYGVMLYEMVSGRQPFQGGYEQAVVHAILSNEPEPLSGLRTGVPLELERIIGKAIAKPRENRYQHLDDLLVDLRAVQERLRASTDSTRIGTRTGSSAATPAPGSQRPLAVLGGIMAAVVVIGALLVGLNIGNLRERVQGEESLSPIRSLAVLPLDNMMGDAEQDFFVEGMHEALITELSKIGTLRVISRTSAMLYKGTDKSIQEIASELDVDALVEGSVLRVENRVRITAQLIRGTNDEHLWAEDYDRELGDILNLLSEVARSIAGEINVALTPRQQERLTTERTVDPDVYEMFLRGLHHLHKFTEKDALESRRYFQQAIDADPNFAMAHAALAGAYIVYSIVGDLPPRDLFPPAQKAAQRALELDPGLGAAFTVLGFVELYFNWDWAAAEREFHRALEQNPNDGDALHGLANVLIIHGRLDEAAELVKRGRQFDPYSYLRNLPVWTHLIMARRYQEAITEVEQWRAFSGSTGDGWHALFRAYYHQGRNEEAMVELRHSSTGCDPESRPAMEKAYTESGIQGAILVCAEHLAALSQREQINPLSIAMYFALAGDADQTFVWLEKANEERVPAIVFLARPDLDPYRSDPRFEDLMQRMGIPESGWRMLGGGGD
ncbi:MAG: protein kinase [bacterium]